MFRWVPYAMVRIAAFFVGGILLAIYNPSLLRTQTASMLVVFLLICYFIFYILIPPRKRSPVIGIIGLAAVLAAGYAHLSVFILWGDNDHLSTFQNEIHYYVATIKDYPEEKENSWKYLIELNKVSDRNTWYPINGDVLLYIRKDKNQAPYFYGDKILVRGSPLVLTPPQNPHEFDFKRFLSFKNIFHQQFAKPEDVIFLQSISQKDIKYYSFKVREWASKQLECHLPNKQEQAIAMALTLGVKDGIDNDLQRAYAASGAMHVLAVSGLHVGILYGIVLLIFKPFAKISWSRWVVAIVSLVVLWAFAFITGLSPSVLRAVTMFSFIALARSFGRNTSIYNTLACSAFLLLLVDPFLIMSVGFQLSYLAVLGIVTIHRTLYQLVEPNSVVLDWVWNISCVSIAAQLATFSLGLLYFHQFPVYFLLSNLFVIPGAVLILVTTILTIAFSFFSPLANLLGSLLEVSIKILNYGVFTFEKFPHSIINGIYISTFQCWLIILAIGFFLIFLYFRRLIALIVVFGFVLSFSIGQWVHYENEIKSKQFVVYSISGHHGLEWISNGRSKFFGDSALISDFERMRFHVLPNRLYYGVRDIELNLLDKDEPVEIVTIEGKVIGVINQPLKSWPQGIKLDYLIVANNSIRSFSDVHSISFEKLILDGSNSRYLANRICEQGGDVVYSVLHQGAFVEKF